MQANYASKYEGQVSRQYRLMRPEAKDEEVKSFLQSSLEDQQAFMSQQVRSSQKLSFLIFL